MLVEGEGRSWRRSRRRHPRAFIESPVGVQDLSLDLALGSFFSKRGIV
jgi:hypothetical protein